MIELTEQDLLLWMENRRRAGMRNPAYHAWKMDKCERLLAELPDDADDIAALLQVQGVRGWKGSASGCPLADWFSRQGLAGIEVGSLSVGEVHWDVDLPPACQTFVRRFDRGEYPGLVPE